MANSVTEICNLALGRIGVERLVDFATDVGTRADRCRDQYPAARDAVSREYAWNCLIRRASLAANATAPAWGYARAFDLPADPYCLRVLEIAGEREWGSRWNLEGRQILTDDAAPLNILYIARIEDASQYDALLVDCLAQRLAAELAYVFAGDKVLARSMWDIYAAKMPRARATDAQEGTPGRFGPDPDHGDAPGWLEARL